MDANFAATAYRTQEVSDAHPVRAVAILYDRAIEALHRAIRGIEDNDFDARRNANEKATRIIGSLGGCIDHENGGEVAANLARLYRFMLLRLMQVDLKNDAQPAREVIGLLEPLRQSWAQLADRVDREGMPNTDGTKAKPAAPAAQQAQPIASPYGGAQAQQSSGGYGAGAGASVTA